MKKRNMLIALGIIVLIGVGGFYAYMHALGSAWTLNKPDKRPFFVTEKPMLVKNILLPEGTKIIYEKQYFWQTSEQNKPLNEKNIIQVTCKEGTTMLWADVPVTAIVKFYNSEMKGFTVYADFSKIDKPTQFSSLWQSCNDDLGVLVSNIEDWSFNHNNIVDVSSCGVNNQRYFKEDQKQQKFLDDLLVALKAVKAE